MSGCRPRRCAGPITARKLTRRAPAAWSGSGKRGPGVWPCSKIPRNASGHHRPPVNLRICRGNPSNRVRGGSPHYSRQPSPPRMSRHRGRRSDLSIERDFPHAVEIAVLPGGQGRRMDAMNDWHRQRGIAIVNGRNRHDGSIWHSRWCFARPADAAEFAARFHGRLI